MDDLDGQARAAGGQQPIEERLRVAQRAAGAAGDDLQGLGLGFDLLLLADLAQRRGDHLGRDAGEVVPLAPRQDGDRDLVRLGGGEEELDVRRRLFQGLQQGVEGPGREHVHFVDVIDLEPSPAGPQRGVLPQLAHLLDAVVAGTVDLDDVDVLPLRRSTGRCRRSGTVPRSAPSRSSDTWRRSGPSRSCRPRASRRTDRPGRSGSAGSHSARPGRRGPDRPRPRTAAADSAGRRPCTALPRERGGIDRPPAPDRDPSELDRFFDPATWGHSARSIVPAVESDHLDLFGPLHRHDPEASSMIATATRGSRSNRLLVDPDRRTPRGRGRGEPGRFSQAHEGVAYGCCVPALTRFTNPHCPGPPRLTLTPAR